MAKLLKLATLILFLCQSYTYAQTQQSVLPERKPLIRETLLVNKGKANGIIVTPNIPEFQKLAKKVQAAIRTTTGTKLQIVADEKIVNQRGEFVGAAPDRNMIVLGSLGNSGVIANLYFRTYCTIDANYPGKDGYVVQTVSDPWGTGVNVIVLGGSNMKGVEKAAARFCTDLPEKTATLSIPRVLRYEKLENSKISDLRDDEIPDILVKSAVSFKNGKQAGLFNPIVQAGNLYQLTGNESQAKLFRELLFLEYDLKTNSPAPFDSPWGGAADFLFAPLIAAWDKVEESTSFSDEDRRRMLEIILAYINYYETYAYIPAFKTSIIRHNHHTFPGQGFTAAGQYFMKYYPSYSEGPKWLEMGDNCFRLQQQSWKSQEDCGGYAGISMRHMSFYATTRPDFTWFDSGRANIAGDLAIMTMDNLGYQCNFGDIAGFNSVAYSALWNSLATVQRNGRYSWAMQKSHNGTGSTGKDPVIMPVYVAPVEPTDLLGTKYLPMDSLFYATLNGTGQVPRKQTFDKLFFRSSFDSQRQYMALDGVNVGYHGHRDGNSVLRLSDRGRIWLAEGDYIKSSAKFHNTLLIFQDDVTSGMPPFVRRDLVADLPSVGMSRTTTPNYSGTDWTRNIIWDKDRAFIFIDEVKANNDEAYSIRTLWHTLGKPMLNNNTYSVSQQGERFSIQNLDGSRLRTVRDTETGKNWIGYKYADPVINTLQQIRTHNLRKGDKLYIMNVMSADADGKAPIEAVRASDSALLLGSGIEQALIGVGGTKIAGLETDAQLYWLTRQRMILGGVKKLILGDKTIFQSADSISVELAADGATLYTDKDTKVTFFISEDKVIIDGLPLKSVERNTITADLSAGKHIITGILLPKELAIEFPRASAVSSTRSIVKSPRKLTEKAQFFPDQSVGARPIASDVNGLYVGGSDGILYALGKDTKPRWTYPIGGDIRAVWIGKLAKDAPERIVVGNAAGKIAVLNQSGQVIWEQQVPMYRSVRAVVYFTSADLKGDGDRSLIVGSDNWHHYAYDTKGQLLWQYLSIHPSSSGTAADLDGDGKEEVIAGTHYYSWHAITPEGKQKWVINRVGPGANAMATADLEGTGKRTVYIAGADGNLYAVAADGKRPWTYNTGDGATCLELMDVDADGKKEILIGTLNSTLIALKANGTRLWRKDIGEPILAMVQTDMDGDGKKEIVVGTEDGHVLALTRDGNHLADWSTSGSVNKLVVLPNGSVAATINNGSTVVLGIEK